MSPELLIFGVLLPWCFAVAACWLGYQLLRQNGRILLHLEALEQRLGNLGQAPAPRQEYVPPPSLPAGSAAPEFELPDLAGGRKALSAFRGKRVLLIFFNPGCSFCSRMAPDLAALPVDGADGRPVPLVVSTGGAEANRKLVEEHGIRCPVLLQEQMEVASLYMAGGTPMGYLLDEEGKIVGEIAVGAEALLDLANPARAGAMAAGGPPAALNGNGHHDHRGNRSLAESHIERNGLSAGTAAPDFRLPRLDEGELSLSEYRGRRVLLVFSSPECAPCEALSPQLEHLSRRIPEVQVLMVSRGDLEANRAKAAQHGLTFPVGLQRQWEVSREYAMFATPIAYLIDEEGVLVSDVVAGVEPIVALLARATVPMNGKKEVAGLAHAVETTGRRS